MESDEERTTLFDVVYGRKSEKVVLLQLTMVAQVPSNAADRTQLGARYENLITQLTKQHKLDYGITGLLLIYPTCLLHIIEASEYMLDCFLNELQAMQEQPDCTLLKAKIAFMCHSLESRQFQQWSCKVLTTVQVDENPLFTRLEKEEESIETVVCRVLTPLQGLVTHLQTSKDLPGTVLDEKPEFLNPPAVLEQLLDRDELLSPQQYLQMYHSPLNICIDFGKRNFILKSDKSISDPSSSASSYPSVRLSEHHEKHPVCSECLEECEEGSMVSWMATLPIHDFEATVTGTQDNKDQKQENADEGNDSD